MQEFTRIIPKKGYEKWPNKLSLMASLLIQTEYQTLKNNLRKATITQVDPNNLDSFLQEINKDRLIFTPFKKVSILNGFSSIAKVPDPGQPFLWNGVVTKNYEDGEKIKKAHLKSDHQTIGEMLGYPDCCINYFINSFPIDPCPIWTGTEGKVNGFPECNGILRYFGPKITAHLSCSPTCQKTREIGKNWFKVMQEINKDLADEIYNLLAGPITWNSYHGVIQVETPYFVGLNNGLFILKKPRIIEWKGVQKILNKKIKKIKK